MVHIHSSIFIVLIGMTVPIEGMCVNDNRTTAANEFLISKWKMRFKVLDVNHDGKISMEDVEELKNKFSDLEHFNAEKKKTMTEVFNKYWNECIFLGRKSYILENEFVHSSETDFNANTEEFAKERRRCYKMIFSAIDINKDKSISKKELQDVEIAYGHPQIAKDNDSFNAYGPMNGLIPLCDVVDYWVDFATSTNESKGDIVKRGFDANGFD